MNFYNNVIQTFDQWYPQVAQLISNFISDSLTSNYVLRYFLETIQERRSFLL